MGCPQLDDACAPSPEEDDDDDDGPILSCRFNKNPGVVRDPHGPRQDAGGAGAADPALMLVQQVCERVMCMQGEGTWWGPWRPLFHLELKRLVLYLYIF